MLLSETQAKDICDKLLSCINADDAQVSVSSEDFSNLRFAANDFTTSGRRENVSVSVTVWFDKKRGSASASSFEEQALKEAVKQAEDLARISPVDHEYMSTLGAQTYRGTAGYVEATANVSLSDRAKAIDGIIRTCEKQGIVGAGFHEAGSRTQAFATKHGNFHYRPLSLASLSVTARTRDGGSSGYFLRDHFDVRKLDTERIGREAIRKALDGQKPRVLQPGVYPVILEPQAAGDLVGLFFDARSADEGRSPFSAPGGKTRLGERIFDERVNFYSDPWHPELPDSPATPEGIPAEKIYFVRNGVLENLHYSRYWANHQGKPPTPGPVNSIVESYAPPVSLEEMIGTTARGLLLSRFWYIRTVDPRTELLTGLTRDGVWYIENGKVQYPVSNFRFNQSVLELLAPGNVEVLGAAERINSSLVPAIKVKAFHFTSLSEAV
jgi:predicted Zn-dependent protease